MNVHAGPWEATPTHLELLEGRVSGQVRVVEASALTAAAHGSGAGSVVDSYISPTAEVFPTVPTSQVRRLRPTGGM